MYSHVYRRLYEAYSYNGRHASHEIQPLLDSIDLTILARLQANARIANAEIARELGVAPSGILERIRKLEARGVIQGYMALIAPRTVGFSLLAYVFVRAEEPTCSATAGTALAAIPEVQEVHQVAGEDCYLVKLRARDTEDLARVLRERIGRIPSIRSTKTVIVLATLRESAAIPLPSAEQASDAQAAG